MFMKYSFPFRKTAVCAALLALLMSSCEDHCVTMDSTKSVGNVVLANNEIISPASFDPNRHVAVGIIFLVREDTAFVVSTHEEGLLAFSEETKSVDGLSSNPFDLAGFENSVAIMASGIWSEAMESIYDRGLGWYLPSAGELKALSMSLNAVERSMSAIGGDTFANDLYLSSTEDGSSSLSKDMYCVCVNVRNGYSASSPKQKAHRTRAVMRLQ